MRCPNCKSENRQSQRFCLRCGARLDLLCRKCGCRNPPEAAFCGDCGTPVLPVKSAVDTIDQSGVIETAESPVDAVITSPHLSPDGERRHLTVLFCDLVGSTAVASQLDPEEWRATVGDYHRAAAEEITRFGGHVVKYLGDGIMALFGWPEAHDNDVERAARAGLAILDALVELAEQPTHAKLAARVGLDSGPVVVGQGAGGAVDVFGDAPNLAARVESAADPGTVMITAATHRLILGLFVVEDRGMRSLKGFAEPIQLYRVIRPSGVHGRLEAAAARGLTAFVGREDELRILNSRWERALDGEGQVALILGEAGIGKSRLVHRFHEQIAGALHTWIDASAGAFFQNSPFYPIIEMLRRVLFAGGDGSPDALTQMAGALNHVGLEPAAAIPLLAPLLNLTLPPEFPPLAMPADQQRRRLLATLVEWVLGASREKPLVIATEDLHWADPSTLELIAALVEQGARSSLLLLYTARPEFKAPWAMRAHHTQITLNRLGARDVRDIIAQVSARSALAEETVAAVVTRTGGVPLFVEELTRAVLERVGASANREIPATLHDSLMARLDRLGSAAKEVAQVAAVIGREFSYPLLNAVHPAGESDLQSALTKLAEAELIYTRGIAPDATYSFKHALIQDAAYEALLKTRRRELHRKVAQTLTEKFAEIAEAHPEVLARHWTEAGEVELAIAAWTKAGQQSHANHASREALESFQQATTLLNGLPASPERDLRELQLANPLLRMLQITKGWGAPGTVEATERATKLAEKSGNRTELAYWLTSRCLTVFFAGDFPAAVALADQALELAHLHGQPMVLAGVHTLQLMARYQLGDLVGAENHFKTGLQYFEDSGFRQRPTSGFVPALGVGSWTAWALGRSDMARPRDAEMIACAEANGPYDVAHAGYHSACLHLYLREYNEAEELAARSVQLSETLDFPQIAAQSRCALGHARAHLGKVTEGVALIRDGIAGMGEVGSRSRIGYRIAALAEAQALQGAFAEALETIQRALEANPHELISRPETKRIRGELRLKLGQNELAETDFHDSIALAQSMSAKAWELRTSMSLARLLRDTNRRDEAHAMLKEIYNWFTEGFDTADLIDAKNLLDELTV